MKSNKLLLLIMIVLLSFLRGWSENNSLSLYRGAIVQDTIIPITIDEIKAANVKLVEAKYIKQENEIYKEIIHEDSVLIEGIKHNFSEMEKMYQEDIDSLKVNHDKEVKKLKRKNAVNKGIGIVLGIVLIVLQVLK